MLTTLACLLGMFATALCLRAWRRCRDTTLAAPCAWAAASLGIVTCDVASSSLGGGAWQVLPPAHVQYLAGITTVAPFVALLGAKRPQNRAWQFIVASLVSLLAFQGLRGWSIDPAVPPTPHLAWRCLLAVLIVAQLLNYLPTRYAASACLAFAGQVGLLAGDLPFGADRSDMLFPAGLGLLGLASLVAFGQRWWLGQSLSDVPAGDWQRAWLEFRDHYGVLWSLRVAERVNALMLGQPGLLRLNWRGFQRASSVETATHDAPAPECDEPIYAALKSVLARFVGPEWLPPRGS
jgi:hypothetical protein